MCAGCRLPLAPPPLVRFVSQTMQIDVQLSSTYYYSSCTESIDIHSDTNTAAAVSIIVVVVNRSSTTIYYLFCDVLPDDAWWLWVEFYEEADESSQFGNNLLCLTHIITVLD